MMIAEAEKLKKELTDKYVVVNQSVAELRRFVGLTGKVKTVNMNCRALVEFDGPVDISWYDIDPSFLTVVEAPQPKVKEKTEEPKSEKTKAVPAKATSGEGGKKLSPLEMARQQGAAVKAAASDPGKKLSPLELARQQGAAGKPAAAPTADSGKKLSPLELARQQGAAKAEAAAPVPVEEPVVETPVEEPVQSVPETAGGGGSATPSSTAEIIALARQQGPFKG